MPTYDYVCSACGHRFEEFHSMTQKPLRKCPQCKKQALERLIGAGAAVIFKGSGFYQTDYKNSGRPPGGKDADGRDAGGKGNDGKDTGGKDAGGKDTGGKDKGGSGNGETAKADAPKGGGPCAPACGTEAAPRGCQMGKDQPGMGQRDKGSKKTDGGS